MHPPDSQQGGRELMSLNTRNVLDRRSNNCAKAPMSHKVAARVHELAAGQEEGLTSSNRQMNPHDSDKESTTSGSEDAQHEESEKATVTHCRNSEDQEEEDSVGITGVQNGAEDKDNVRSAGVDNSEETTELRTDNENEEKPSTDPEDEMMNPGNGKRRSRIKRANWDLDHPQGDCPAL